MNPIVKIKGWSVSALKDGEMSLYISALIKSDPPELLLDFMNNNNITDA